MKFSQWQSVFFSEASDESPMWENESFVVSNNVVGNFILQVRHVLRKGNNSTPCLDNSLLSVSTSSKCHC